MSTGKPPSRRDVSLRAAAEQEYGRAREELHRWADETAAFIEAAPVLPDPPPALPRIRINLT